MKALVALAAAACVGLVVWALLAPLMEARSSPPASAPERARRLPR